MSSPLLLRLAVLAQLGTVLGAVKPYITSTVEIDTECKTCPHSLCPNKIAYDFGENLNATCWTHGTKIMGDRLWLKIDTGCYVTQWDINEYNGTYEKDLSYCGRESEEEHITTEDATLKYKSECRICPTLLCENVAYLPEETDLTLTCWTDQGQTVIDDPYWLKTTNNCYVAQKSLYSKPDITYLDNCGPIPTLDPDNHFDGNGTTDIDKRSESTISTLARPHQHDRRAPKPHPVPEPLDFGSKYLINVTVGEEYAYCRSCPDSKCRVETRYKFNQEVWLQCLVENNGTFWSETTDFCYVKNTDFWESPEGDYYKNPLCANFEDPSEDDGRAKLV